MFKKFLLIGLLCFGLVALLGVTQATAGCVRLCPGVKLCDGAIVYGSTDVIMSVTGLGSLECLDKKTGDLTQCPQFISEVGGTVDAGDGLCGDGKAGDTYTGDCVIDPDCDVEVYAVCGPKSCANNPEKPGCGDPADLNSAHFPSTAVPLEIVQAFCKHNGRCDGLAPYLEENYPGICSPGLVLLFAYIGEMNHRTTFCYYPFDANGNCSGDPDLGQYGTIETYFWVDSGAEIGTTYNESPPLNLCE